MSLQDKARRYWRVVVLVIGALCVVAGLIGYGQGGGDKQGSAQEGFVNKVWQIKTSNSIEPGMLYVFLSDGTLVMASPSSQPLASSPPPTCGSPKVTSQVLETLMPILCSTLVT